ncbi:MAG: SDR family NAD(P)-dependent oxidoreductase [SAR324 cluster bacterium]|nr:SDR family NAD(P)-dependent oxidoreductase [SAR324 cluster bacterium]MED6339345.1 SDR family NAD(P)-dependent oxidoreductase [SAR324 cluster bacterium]MEE2599223.1 SDR family NAD(P)-dependent oxidoreductase [SAR324 cluster bacterium]
MESSEKKVIMISGANRGIGRAIAERLLGDGYLLSLGVRNLAKLPNTLKSQVETQILYHSYDARDRESAKKWVDLTAEKFGGIDVLVNNAGILHTNGLEDDAEELLDDMWEVNAKAPLRLTRLAFPYLRESGSGRVIDIISMSGKRIKGDWVGYSMSKYAAMAASQTARLKGWDDGIRVTSICTGFVQSDMTVGNVPSFPQKNMSRPEDVAQVVSTLLLLSNESAVPEVTMNCVFETL